MDELEIRFERIGRSHDVLPLRIPLDHPDRVAEAVWRYAGRFLASRDYDVDVRLPAGGRLGTVSIGWGRFGSGTIRLLATEEPQR